MTPEEIVKLSADDVRKFYAGSGRFAFELAGRPDNELSALGAQVLACAIAARQAALKAGFRLVPAEVAAAGEAALAVEAARDRNHRLAVERARARAMPKVGLSK